MPMVDGIKMACAACIRGHRSASCHHVDRPLLKVRRKGRPVSHCDQCRDLRKALHIYSGCICEPDKSEAPKRKGKKDKAATIGGLQLLNISEDQISLSSLQQTITLPKPAPQTEAHRFMPVSDLISATYEGQILSESQEDIRPANAVSTFDSETIALWEQFMNDDPAKQQGPIIPGINEELLVPPTCPCPHDSCCRICPPDGTNIPTPQSSTSPANRFANCTGFDCCDLMVAISRIAEEVLAAGNDPAPLRSKSMRGSTLAQAQLSSDQDLPVSDLSNWPILEDEAASQLRSEPFAAGLGFDTSFPVLCTYESDCDCAVCPSKSPATGFSRDEEEYCVACVFCIKTSTID